MTRRLPIISTLVVAVAVAIMIGLGMWQLQRRNWKDALITRYTAALEQGALVAWPRDSARYPDAWYHRSALVCDEVLEASAGAGRNRDAVPGWAHTARCRIDGGGEATVALGWSQDPARYDWAGGRVTGTVQPAGEEVRLVAEVPPPGLAPLARPDPRDLPNNHFAYAVQWFLFAITAAVVYALAVRRHGGGVRQPG